MSAKNTLEKFWSNVASPDGNGCWNYLGGKNSKGYGLLRHQGERVYTHRLAWELINGQIPDGLCALHKCDNPLCCNPDHLFLGTRKDNSMDMDAKGRRRPALGERNSHSKLTARQVQTMRAFHANGTFKRRELASIYGIGYVYTTEIISGKFWKHIPIESSDRQHQTQETPQ